ncbi:putative bifunctional diguanylate cyclase/phosphodiesterase [Psychromonas sp. PT13]|uniref:putative bifunctional diguanylate cyclase/phosphodiesterase n=1 Tax=Psychromonas sp. PT13 TaxID=3439547 RepID=UPI003EBAE0B0
MTINRQLTVLMLLIIFFSIIVAISTFKVASTSRLNQLNSQHFNHLIEFNELITINEKTIPDTDALKVVVKIIQDQPEMCVAIIGSIDRFFMRLIETGNIFSICQNDIELADDFLKSIELFEAGIITESEMKAEINSAYNGFRANSINFIGPVDKLTDFIVIASNTLIVVLSIVFFLLTFAISKSILNVVKMMQRKTEQLAISEEKNRFIASNDMLTGLPNRHALDMKIKDKISTVGNQKFAIFCIDLDRFKDINDTRGHATGDKLLISIAKRLSEIMRKNDLVFRFGGDEFVAIVNYSESIDGIYCIARALVKAISEPIWLGKSDIYLTGSIGVAVYPNDAKDAESLIKYADTAMYEAKKKGKNQYQFYQQTFSKEQIRRLSYESQLRTAIEKEQLSVVYQPVVNLNTFAIQGTEALLRWQLDQDTIIPPDVFIPIAEYSGQIVEIGEWVLREACRQNKLWRDSGATNLNIAVNVSPYQLFSPNFSKLVQDVMSEFDIPPYCLDLEITESMTIAENPCILKTLNELSEMGARLLMDDFGTGYSSLSYLRKLPFDILKIDKSFVSHYDAIASTIIVMGKQLDMKVIAEGVETQECLDILLQQRCDYAQGYFFQRPILPEQLDIFKIYNK